MMTPSQNLHTHTRYADGTDTVREMASAAIEAGLSSLGFSEHGITPFDPDYSMTCEGALSYEKDVRTAERELSGQLDIFLGVEQDYYSEEPPFCTDYRIGSVHYIRKNGDIAVVDGSAATLLENAAKYWNGSFSALAEDYYTLVTGLPEKTGCSIIGHLDLLTKYNEKGDLFDESDPRYIDAAVAAADALCAKGMIFEINTGAMARGRKTSPYPAPFLLRRIRERKGRIVISSDCHYRSKLTFGFPTAVLAARWAGFTSVCLLTRDGFAEEKI